MRGKRFFSEDDTVDFNRVNYFSICLYNTHSLNKEKQVFQQISTPVFEQIYFSEIIIIWLLQWLLKRAPFNGMRGKRGYENLIEEEQVNNLSSINEREYNI